MMLERCRHDDAVEEWNERLRDECLQRMHDDRQPESHHLGDSRAEAGRRVQHRPGPDLTTRCLNGLNASAADTDPHHFGERMERDSEAKESCRVRIPPSPPSFAQSSREGCPP